MAVVSLHGHAVGGPTAVVDEAQRQLGKIGHDQRSHQAFQQQRARGMGTQRRLRPLEPAQQPIGHLPACSVVGQPGGCEVCGGLSFIVSVKAVEANESGLPESQIVQHGRGLTLDQMMQQSVAVSVLCVEARAALDQ